jgi:hypothetical protein
VSNQLAIATVTGALHFRLSQVVRAAVPGAQVTNVRPNADSAQLPTPSGVNVFLYQVTPNVAQRNSDLPTRRSDGTLLKKPVVALDLHYMLSFYGDETAWEPQVLLGAVVRSMHAQPSIDAAAIDAMLADGSGLFTPLALTDLNQAPDPVRFTPTALTFEEMSKLWGIFYQIPYVLSVAYVASVVLIDAPDVPRATLPVTSFQVGAVPLENPVLTSAVSSTHPGMPLVLSDQLVLTGTVLTGGTSQTVLIDGAATTVTTATAERYVVDLPAGISAGVHTVRLTERVQVTPVYASVVDSNTRTFAVAPAITAANAATTPPGPNGVTVDIAIGVVPVVGPKQRLALALTQPGGVSYFLAAHLDQATGNVLASATATGTVAPIPAGTYDLRVFVDGIPSVLGSSVLVVT